MIIHDISIPKDWAILKWLTKFLINIAAWTTHTHTHTQSFLPVPTVLFQNTEKGHVYRATVCSEFTCILAVLDSDFKVNVLLCLGLQLQYFLLHSLFQRTSDIANDLTFNWCVCLPVVRGPTKEHLSHKLRQISRWILLAISINQAIREIDRHGTTGFWGSPQYLFLLLSCILKPLEIV